MSDHLGPSLHLRIEFFSQDVSCSCLSACLCAVEELGSCPTSGCINVRLCPGNWKGGSISVAGFEIQTLAILCARCLDDGCSDQLD
ncbi:hypothetical protein M6B38_226655 [Iris pallida]|uniref:Uncharacterized protein n=1 Tax=Iris pallida TaxID=29817 RepID=A0AAX6DUI0_IRIPA|nr:hypothetical protein M6B38_226655 [Iris pallida]